MSNEKNRPENQPEEQAAETPVAENASLREQYEAALAERDANHDRWLRTQAEMDNMRRRNAKEMEEQNRYRSLPLLRDMLSPLDNLKRAVDAAKQNPQCEELMQGIQLVIQQFQSVLSSHAIKPIESVGQPFDPNLHEAILQLPDSQHPPMTVLQEVETGYQLHDRVVRPSKVIVSAAPPDAP